MKSIGSYKKHRSNTSYSHQSMFRKQPASYFFSGGQLIQAQPFFQPSQTIAQSILQRGKKNDKATAEQEASAASDHRISQFGQNWATLNHQTYIDSHNLKFKKSERVAGKTVLHLQDGSIILKDSGGYWRHESATTVNAYYDNGHAINSDNALTHFWDSDIARKNKEHLFNQT